MAALSANIAAFAADYAERGIDSTVMGVIMEDDDLFVNGPVLTVLPKTLIILALVVVFTV